MVLEPYAGLHEVSLADVGISLPESGCMHHLYPSSQSVTKSDIGELVLTVLLVSLNTNKNSD